MAKNVHIVLVDPEENRVKAGVQRFIFYLSVFQIVVGLLLILIQAFLLLFDRHLAKVFGFKDSGLNWLAGLLFGITGGLGFYVVKHFNKCSLVSLLILSTLSAIVCLPILLLSFLELKFFQNGHVSVVTYLLISQMTLSVIEAIVAILSSCVGCQNTCCSKVRSVYAVECRECSVEEGNSECLTFDVKT